MKPWNFIENDPRLLQIAEAVLLGTALLIMVAGFWLITIISHA